MRTAKMCFWKTCINYGRCHGNQGWAEASLELGPSRAKGCSWWRVLGKRPVIYENNPPDFGLLFLAQFARFSIRPETEVTVHQVHTHSQTNRHFRLCPAASFGFSVGNRKFETSKVSGLDLWPFDDESVLHAELHARVCEIFLCNPFWQCFRCLRVTDFVEWFSVWSPRGFQKKWKEPGLPTIRTSKAKKPPLYVRKIFTMYSVRPGSLEPRSLSLRSARPSWKGPWKTPGHFGNCKVDGSVRSQFSPFFTLIVARVPCCEMSRAYITVLQHVRFVSIDKIELSWRKVSDWQALGFHRQSNSRYTCPSFEVMLLVSFLIMLLCHLCFNGLAKQGWKEKPIDGDLVNSTGLIEKLRKRSSTPSEGVREPDVYDSVRGFAFFKHAFAIRIRGILWWPRKHMTFVSQIFFLSSLKLATHRQPLR